MYQTDIKFDRQLRPATETSWVVSYSGTTISRWRTAAILKIIISPYLSEKSSDFDEILYTATNFELDERQVIKSCVGQTPSSTERISCFYVFLSNFIRINCKRGYNVCSISQTAGSGYDPTFSTNLSHFNTPGTPGGRLHGSLNWNGLIVLIS